MDQSQDGCIPQPTLPYPPTARVKLIFQSYGSGKPSKHVHSAAEWDQRTRHTILHLTLISASAVSAGGNAS